MLFFRAAAVRSVFCSAMPILAAEDARFTDRVFRVLDTNNSGIIEWPEFVYAVSCLEKGTLEQRADFLFQVRPPPPNPCIHTAATVM